MTRTTPPPPLRIGISSCLLGENVRFDGGHKRDAFLIGTLARFVDLTSAGPQRVFGIAGKGRIAIGYDADFTVVDLKQTRVIEDEWIGSKCGWTPFAGMKVRGWPKGTIVRGRLAMWEGDVGEAKGAPVRFGEALPRA